ncbi:MAG: AI-2E family transporter [Ignavibacteriales bacterium]|nr:AI-2E family transporter [Ignavibacteriales bacterium]
MKELSKAFEPQIKEFASNILSGILGLGSTVLLTLVSIIIAGALLAKADSAEIVARKAFKILIGKKGEGFTELAGATIRSVVQGVLGVAIIQSVVSGIVMLIFNIPLAGLWALIVLFFAIIQLPPLIILLPIAVYSFSILDTTSAIIFLVLSIIISMSDAFLKPIFSGERCRCSYPGNSTRCNWWDDACRCYWIICRCCCSCPCI